MPNRPRAHVLEEESTIAFVRALPNAWIFRPELKDYGIDGSVEVVDGEGRVSGQRFYVQLKATDEENLKQALRIRIKKDWLTYYGTVDLPVLFVRYHAPTEQLFVRWVHDFDVYYAKVHKTSIAFDLDGSDLWTEKTPSRIQAELENCRWIRSPDLVLPAWLRLEITPDAVSERRREIAVAVEALASRVCPGLIVSQIPRGVVRGDIQITSTEIVVHLPAGKRTILHHKKGDLERLSVDILAADSTLAIAMALSRAGQHHVACQIFGQVLVTSSLAAHTRVLEAVSNSFNSTRDGLGLLRAANDLDMALPSVLAGSPLRTVLMVGELDVKDSAAMRTEIARWVRITENTTRPTAIAITHYNVGRFLYSRLHDHVGVVRHYRLAAKADPQYRRRHYFWAELGAMLFDRRHFQWAAKAYREALQLGAGQEIQGRYGDALLHAGKYSEATQAFRKYRAAGKGRPQWILTARATEIILEEIGQESQIRNPSGATLYLETALNETHGLNDRREAATQALREDGLCAAAWFVLGVIAAREEMWGTTFACFCVAALLDRSNPICWSNAFLASMNDRHLTPWGMVVLSLGLEIHGAELYREISANLALSLPTQLAQEASRRLQELLSSGSLSGMDPQKGEREMRILAEDGSFEIITLPRPKEAN